ncbi:hypothetical protein AT251_11250 [Enterovibrio nigricans]|nr:hypothetical protein AT251_11250 [Enterovibrio nigricans]
MVGCFEVSDVSMQGVNSRIQQVVDYWVNKVKTTGYDIKSDISFNSTTFYSKEQALGSLGVSYKDLSTSISAALSVESNSEKQVSMAMLKQTYYSVFYNPGSSPSLLFSDDISLDDVKMLINDETPPGYISQLDYGRIVFFKLETSSSSINIDLEALMKYGKGEVEISAEMKAKYELALKDSKLSVVTIGGNANTNIEVVSVRDIENLLDVIKDKESVSITNKNVGVPISYTTKQLKDSALAKRYLVTDYVTNECKLFKNGWIELKHAGGYVAHFLVTWQERGKSQRSTWKSGNTTAGYVNKVVIPATATDVRCDAWVYTGLVWQPQNLAYRNTFEGAPNCCIEIKGTTLKPYAKVTLG